MSHGKDFIGRTILFIDNFKINNENTYKNKLAGERVNQFKNVDLQKYNLPKITKKEDENKDNASKERR